MIILNKKGSTESSLNWIIGAIIGILLTSVIILVAVQWYMSTAETQNSFDTLIQTIQNMEEDEQNSTTIFLPEEHILVSFQGKDFNTGNYFGECSENVNIPDSCGDYPCICICNGKWMADFDKACEKKAVACYPFTSESEDFLFKDFECGDFGLYREGPSNGVFTLYFHHEGKILEFCETKDCVFEDHQEATDAFKQLTHDIDTCIENDNEGCYCELDFSFLEEKYALNFYNTQIMLWDIVNENIVYAEDWDNLIDLDLSITNKDKFKDEYLTLYYSTTETIIESEGLTNVLGAAVATDSYDLVTNTYLTISPSTEDIVQFSNALSENQLTVSDKLLKGSNSINFVNNYYDFTSLSNCEDTGRTSSGFIN